MVFRLSSLSVYLCSTMLFLKMACQSEINYCTKDGGTNIRSVMPQNSLADGGGGGCGVWGERGSKFFQFHAFFGKIWQNRMLAPLLQGFLDPPLELLICMEEHMNTFHLIDQYYAINQIL